MGESNYYDPKMSHLDKDWVQEHVQPVKLYIQVCTEMVGWNKDIQYYVVHDMYDLVQKNGFGSSDEELELEHPVVSCL